MQQQQVRQYSANRGNKGRRQDRDDRQGRQSQSGGGPLSGLRKLAASQFRRGDEQFTAFTWSAGWPGAVETGNIRRYVRDLAVLAVGYTGQTDRDGNEGELATVVAPVKLWEAVFGGDENECRQHHQPNPRTMIGDETHGRKPLHPDSDRGWIRSAGFLAEQLLTLLKVCRGTGEKLEQNHQVFGPTAVRCPKLAIDMSPTTPDESGIPAPPTFIHTDSIEDASVLEGIDAGRLVYDMDTINTAYDIREWTRDNRALKPAYGVCPWFVMPCSIRSVHADLGIVKANWWLH